jgi:hypothetical protein
MIRLLPPSLLLAIAIATVTAPLAAQPALLFKCAGEHGETSYQQTACRTPEGTLGTVEVAVFEPPPSAAEPQPPRAPTGRGSRRDGSAATPPFGYGCSGGGRSWVGREPCPAMVEVVPPRPRWGAAAASRQVAVRQRDLDRGSYCGFLRSQPRSGDVIYRSNLAGC